MPILSLEDAVRDHPFSRGMNPGHQRILAECAMFTRFDPGQIIFHEGEIANRFYLIRSGQVSIETPLQQGGVLTVQSVGRGDVLGWSWLFSPYFWHYTACAIQPTEAIFFYGTLLRERCDTDREFGFQLMRRVTNILMQRLQATLKETLRLAADVN